MHKIDSAGNVGGLFTEGDPGLGIQPTKVSDDWLNAVQTEIVNVIEEAGIVLNKADNTQLIAAIHALRRPTLLNPFVTLVKADLTIDNAWHTLTIAGVPITATWLYIGGYVQNQGGPDNARQKIYMRPSNAGQQMLISFTNGVGGSYENDHAIGPMMVPCNGQHFDYKITDSLTDVNFVVYGYQ